MSRVWQRDIRGTTYATEDHHDMTEQEGVKNDFLVAQYLSETPGEDVTTEKETLCDG